MISALHWCDHIYVFDNGSNDGTWELVKELAKQHRQIVPYKQDDDPIYQWSAGGYFQRISIECWPSRLVVRVGRG